MVVKWGKKGKDTKNTNSTADVGIRPERITNKLDHLLVAEVSTVHKLGQRQKIIVLVAAGFIVTALVFGYGYYRLAKKPIQPNTTTANEGYHVSTGTSHQNEEDTQKSIEKAISGKNPIITPDVNYGGQKDDDNVPE